MRKLKDLKHKIKMFIQRGKNGYCDEDTWSIDSWFVRIFPKMLTQLKAEKMGHPADLKEEEWDNILQEMIDCFKKADLWSEEPTNEYWEEYIQKGTEELREKWIEREKEINQLRIYNKDKGFNLMSKYFYDLWN